jgi:ribonuclease E
MLIDAGNPEEIRVCVLQNGKVEDFDFESASRKPLRGNIYLARVTRVEPSLQAAFVEFGGNRHGFLAFNEIHPDYYQIPISDRRQIQEAEAEEAAIAAALNLTDQGEDGGIEEIEADLNEEAAAESGEATPSEIDDRSERANGATASDEADLESSGPIVDDAVADDSDEIAPSDIAEVAYNAEVVEAGSEDAGEGIVVDDEGDEDEGDDDESEEDGAATRPRKPVDEALARLSRPQLIEKYKDARRKRARLLRNYKIQEVIKRRQILLVQAVKEERGNKGAALTTYLSLAGRYCVLMPNTARGGGISRKIPVAADRKRLRRIVDGLDVPTGMGLIIRTAGAKRTKAEIKRDYDYLVRLWENIRTLTLKSIAPCLIYEEASLIKRAIRDLYDKDIGEVLVEGDGGYREAKDFMKMLMPSHAKNVRAYKERTPLFLQYGVESQLDAMYRPTVRLKSGGYIVINQTEALIAIDVNSGKSTRERNIEQTALRTNLEAADEAARQFRLRDLAGLIVIDFIDMEEGRNNRAVEKRLKDALRHDRARIQLGRISAFGLLEMSRQRRRSGIVDGTTHLCPTCGGVGNVRSHEMAALRILRSAENEAISSKASNIQIKAALDVTLYILNQKREWLRRIETDYGVTIEIAADPAKAGDNFEVEKTGARAELGEQQVVVRADTTETIEPLAEESVDELGTDESAAPERSERDAVDEERGGRRRRRRRRRRHDGSEARPEDSRDGDVGAAERDAAYALGEGSDEDEAAARSDQPDSRSFDGQPGDESDRGRKRRRRGRRGGRRGRRPDERDSNREGDTAPIENADAGHEDEQPVVAAEPYGWSEPETIAPLAIGAEQDRIAAVEQAEEMAREEKSEIPARVAVVNDEPLAAREGSRPPASEERPVEPVKPARKGWWNRALGG